MTDINSLLFFDPEIGSVPFIVERNVYKRNKTETIRLSQGTTLVIGVIQPASAEEIQAKPGEDIHEEYIAVYTNFILTAGESYGRSFTTPDRILWNGKIYRVTKARSWPQFHYCQALAVALHETEDSTV